MRKFLAVFLILIMTIPGFGQEIPEAYKAYKARYPMGPALNSQDSLWLMNLPEKTLPAALRSDPLPAMVDNSSLPYLRPVFEQQGPSCGQAAMVGYNFTYEMAYRRDLSAQEPQNQYPSHFTWNFQNGGNGWYGVSYFHSLEILRTVGCMNSFDYGDYYDDGFRWINGYELYYHGMFNRIKGAYSIKTDTEEGILALKHWLYDHMGEGIHGGVASFYANAPWNPGILDEGTPEAGEYIMYEWYPIASHAMTIVGYNDSIRWDYNNDGLYTNNIDQNGDGVVNPRDWEIGAVKFVNSHGPGAQNEGFCYMTYRCLAENFELGGIWNKSVHILDIDENYQPLMTYKITLKHNERERVKIYAGVSQDTSDNYPARIMDFPIIDHQGDKHYMQGHDTAENLKSLEFGLDITPLLGNLQSGEPAKFFFMVDETDPYDEGQGQISSFSLMDYSAGQLEVISPETPADLENDTRTVVSLVYAPEYEQVEIITDSLPPYTIGQPYSCQLQAAGGSAPYDWEPEFNYLIRQSAEPFPEIDDQQILFSPLVDTIMPVALNFNFPYFSNIYDTVYMHADGHLQFDDSQLPWPYMQEPEIYFRNQRIIAPLESYLTLINVNDGDGGWAEITDSCATFRWKLSQRTLPASTEINFAVRIWQNGNIDFIHGLSSMDEMIWLSGISAGNGVVWNMSPFTGGNPIPGSKISFLYQLFPAEFDLSSSGLLTGTLAEDDRIYNLSFSAKDQNGLTAHKTLQLTSGPYLYFTVNGEPVQDVEFDQTVSLDLEIMNGGVTAMPNTTMTLTTNDPYLTITDAECNPGTLLPGHSATFTGAFQFEVSVDIPDQRDVMLQAVLTSEDHTWIQDLLLKARAPVIRVRQFAIDTEDGFLYPGETAPLMITLHNSGSMPLDGVSAILSATGPELQVIGNPVQDYGTIGKGISITRAFTLKAGDSTPEGTLSSLSIGITSTPGVEIQDTVLLRIGKAPVLVIDMDPVQHSGPVIFAMLDQLGVMADYDNTISNAMDEYQSLFICLGYQNFNHVLTYQEGQQIADFLDAGGKVYIEGRKTWRDDPVTPAQPKFNLAPVVASGIYDTIVGIDGTFTQGISLSNEAITPFSFYYLQPAPPAFTVLQDNNTGKSCAVAYDAGTYKTIGALFEYGTMADISENASRKLMIKYLEFFDIPIDPVGIEEKVSEGMQVKVYPNPAGKYLSIVPSPTLPQLGKGVRVGAYSQPLTISLEILDLYGREVMNQDNIPSWPYRIDISGLTNGMYLLRMIAENGWIGSVKFLKVVD